jgi:hypothetical protein
MKKVAPFIVLPDLRAGTLDDERLSASLRAGEQLALFDANGTRCD